MTGIITKSDLQFTMPPGLSPESDSDVQVIEKILGSIKPGKWVKKTNKQNFDFIDIIKFIFFYNTYWTGMQWTVIDQIQKQI